MTKRHLPADGLNNLLGELVEDVVSRTDEEVRAELAEDGESLRNYSAAFRRALRRAKANLASREPSAGLVAIDCAPTSSEVLRRFHATVKIEERYGSGRRGSRSLCSYRGSLPELLELLPEFDEAPFTPGEGVPPHPDRRLVMRQPDGLWSPMAVGAVSDTYRLIQHRDAVAMCLRGLERSGIRRDELRGELTLAAFGEWMSFAFLLPDEYTFRDTYGHDASFRCVVSNSVDESSPLWVRFDWFRQVCENGLVALEHRTVRKRHVRGLDLDEVEKRVFRKLEGAREDGRALACWQRQPVSLRGVGEWADRDLKREWKEEAAGRVYAICASGGDVKLERRWFGEPSDALEHQKPGSWRPVPGSPERATSKYDVAQAMSWVASRDSDIVARVRRQDQIPRLLDLLRAA